jgi:L-ascorbate metabolism protein UlaG (beta-lactamase superfamily)
MNSHHRRILFLIAFAVAACAPKSKTGGSVTIHYLGHASFVLEFDNGVRILTDYGESRAWGLDSPIYDTGSLVPDVMTLSHDHADHAGGKAAHLPRSVLRNMDTLTIKGIEIRAIGTYEKDLEHPDNADRLFVYRGMKILFLGDCQALITHIADPEIRDRVRRMYPDRYDLVFVPVGYITDIEESAVEFVSCLDFRVIVPMHFWSPKSKDVFLTMLEKHLRSSDTPYTIERKKSARFVLLPSPGVEPLRVIGLEPAAYPR